MSWPKEDRIVFACSRINANAKLCQEIKENLNSDLNWDYLLETAEDDGVISLLYRILKDFGNGLVPDRVGDILKRNYLETTARNFFIRFFLDISSRKYSPIVASPMFSGV
ncbi:MAG: nucleotidyltransferase family protein, partial [Candidatus Omnitrophica bacterium]|nr:nucleotidyltransferase family protein [Candidatus Omnitrophota bacterium]